MLSFLKPVRVCLATMLMLAAQFSLGMIVNLYVSVPASDQHAGFVQEVKTAPFALTVHVLVGLVLIGAAGVFIVRAAGIGDRLVIGWPLPGSARSWVLSWPGKRSCVMARPAFP